MNKYVEISGREFYVGDTVTLLKVNNSARGRKDDDEALISEGVIKNIGSKFFYVLEEGSYGAEFKINISTLDDSGSYIANRRVYACKEDIRYEREVRRYAGVLREYFNGYGVAEKLTLSQCKAIVEILKIDETQND